MQMLKGEKRMLFSLVKKDFLIVKKYVTIMLIVSFVIPPIMVWRTPEASGDMGFTLSVIFSIFMYMDALMIWLQNY